MPVLSSPKRRRPIQPAPRLPALPEPEQLVEADPVALEWVGRTIRASRRTARWQVAAELAIAGIALVIAAPAIVAALRQWWWGS